MFDSAFEFEVVLIGVAVCFLLVRILQVLKPHVYVDEDDSEKEQELIPQNVSEQLTVSEHVYLREKAYADRISKMKEELANKVPIKVDNTPAARELHPDVHNLPHDTINAKQQANSILPDVEISG